MDRRPPHGLLVLLLAVAAFAAYANSLSCPFVFDDTESIVNNPHIRRLWPPWEAVHPPPPRSTLDERPVVAATLALNFAAGDLDVVGYHLVNIAIHLLAALTLFGLVRRLLLRGKRPPVEAAWLAFAAALLWMLHPLQTESVTYVIQRAESLGGLFYLLTLYAWVRAVEAGDSWRWTAASLGAFSLGMAAKQTLATAPLAVLLMDRTFLAGDFRAALQRRTRAYAAFAGIWLAFTAWVVARWEVRWDEPASTGLIPPPPLKDYLLTQPVVLLHYLKLSFWPSPLVLDYGWPLCHALAEAFLPGLAVLALLGGAVWALARSPALGFCALGFFLILAPTSSFHPLPDPAAEHRVYLSLACLACLAVVGGWDLSRRLALPARVPVLLLVLASGVLLALTVSRNADYRSALSIWTDTVAKSPGNYRAHNNLGLALQESGDLDAAVACHREAIRLREHAALNYFFLGLALTKKGLKEDALANFLESVRLSPEDPRSQFNLGVALGETQDLDGAIRHLAEAVRLRPEHLASRCNLGLALLKRGNTQEAIGVFSEVERRDPANAVAQYNLGLAYERLGNLESAVDHLQRAARMEPENPGVRESLARVLAAR